MCVCVYIYTHTYYTHTHTYIHTHIYIHKLNLKHTEPQCKKILKSISELIIRMEKRISIESIKQTNYCTIQGQLPYLK